MHTPSCIIELLGMSNAGKSTIGRQLETDQNSPEVKYWEFRYFPSQAARAVTNEELCLKSLNAFKSSFSALQNSLRPSTVFIVDRGLYDKKILYTTLNKMGIINKKPIQKCNRLIETLSWNESGRVVFNLEIDRVFARERLAGKPINRWEAIFGQRTVEGFELLHMEYAAISPDDRTIIIDGSNAPEINFKIVNNFLSRMNGL